MSANANPVILDCEATKVEGSDASLPVILDCESTTPTHRRPILAEISLKTIPVEVNMQKMVGVVFARLAAVEQTLKTRLDGFEKRLEALEAKCQREN